MSLSAIAHPSQTIWMQLLAVGLHGLAKGDSSVTIPSTHSHWPDSISPCSELPLANLLATPSQPSSFLPFLPSSRASNYAQTDAEQGSPDRAHVEEVLRGLNRGRGFGQVGISPDGKKLAWIEGGRGGCEIRVASPTDLTKSERVTAATNSDQHCREGEFAWSPDSKSLAFFSDCANAADHQVDLYLSKSGRQSCETLDDPQGTSASACILAGWHQDRIPLRRRCNAACRCTRRNEAALGCDRRGRRGNAARGHGARGCVSVPPHRLTPANLHVYEYDWAPDSKGMAYVAAEPPGENNWWVAKLYTRALGSQPKPILAPADVAGPLHGLQIAVPRWSPDGKTIAFIGGLMSDQGSTGGDVWIVSADGGEPRDLTRDARPLPPGSSGAPTNICL